MSREWQPGDVAMVAFGDGTEERVFREGYGSDGDGAARWLSASNGQCYVVDDGAYRPLVVIDPEDREQVERLCDALYGGHSGVTDKVQASLRQFADPKPQIEEPTGRFAVVVDVDGREWVLGNDGRWHFATATGKQPHSNWIKREWTRIKAVKVLSEGVS